MLVVLFQDSEGTSSSGLPRSFNEPSSTEIERSEGNGNGPAGGEISAPSTEVATVSLEELQHLAGDADIKVRQEMMLVVEIICLVYILLVVI
jgi:hypothetical protein